MLRLSPPKHVTFFISIAVAIIAVIIHYAKIDIPHVHSGFVILLIGYLVLVAGNVGVKCVDKRWTKGQSSRLLGSR